MPFGNPRSDVRKALEEASVSGVLIKIVGAILERSLEEQGYVKTLAADRIVIGRDKEGKHGLPIMLSDIHRISFWEEPGDFRDSNPDPEPVGDPPPKSGSPGKREQIPEPDQVADAVLKV